MNDGKQSLPAWARAADFATAGLVLVAVTVAASGGFRTNIQGVRVALTSPYRVLVLAVGITIVRHAFTREHPMYRHLVERASAWRRSIALRNALLVAVATRPVVLFVGYLAVIMFGLASGVKRFDDFSNELLSAGAPGAGAMLYSLYIWQFTGNPIAWALGHGVCLGWHYEGLTTIVTDHYNFITNAGLTTYVNQRPYDVLNGLGAIFVLAAVAPVARRFSWSFALFILVSILPPIAAGGLMSVGRFSAVLFPAFLWLASAIPERHRAGWIAGFASLQAFSAALFYTWRPLY